LNGEVAAAYAYCRRLARQHYENFPVASILLPPSARPHVAAVYAFARLADDMADEGVRPAADRLRDLEAWQSRLHAAVNGAPLPDGPHREVFVALQNTIRASALPVDLLDDLLSAFRQDVTVTRYATWADLLDYCRRSANPVGRLVLRIAGYHDGARDEASDAVCTALQLTNFWQDLAIDWRRGRLYVPEEIWKPAGAREPDLDAGRMTPEWRAALREAARRTRSYFAAGRPIGDAVHGRLRWELRATWLGGTTILDKLDAADFDVFTHRPALSSRDAPALAWRLFRWQTG
jgi:phytoene synthase